MIGDPNWLYSTIAQSSAAIVAIIGGFITASVLMLTAEKRNLKNQLANKKFYLQNQDKYPLLDTRSLQQEITDLDARVRAFSYPPLLGWGFVVLGCFAFGSIVLPVMVIMIEIYSMQIKQFIFILFILGLAAVFAYIGFQIRELKRK